MTDLLQRFVSYYQPACGVKLSVGQKQRLTIARLYSWEVAPSLASRNLAYHTSPFSWAHAA